jgi:hypothetical protein
MHQRNLLARIENAERVADAALGQTFAGGCICFPKNDPPCFGWPIEEQIAARLKCPLHGERFRPTHSPNFHVYVAKWLREKLPTFLWSRHSEQYRKAWFASFPPERWPAEEVIPQEGPRRWETGKLRLKLKDGTMLPVIEPLEKAI